MRTYHALYKPSTRKNPRRTRGAKANPYPRARRTRKNGSSQPFTEAEVRKILKKIGVGVRDIVEWPRIAEEADVVRVMEVFTEDQPHDRDSTGWGASGLVVWERNDGTFDYLYGDPSKLLGAQRREWVTKGVGFPAGSREQQGLKEALHRAIANSKRGEFQGEMAWANPKAKAASQRKMKAFLRKNPDCESVYVVTLENERRGHVYSEFFMDGNAALASAKKSADEEAWDKSSVWRVYPQGPGQIADREAIWFSEESNPRKKKATKRKAKVNPKMKAFLRKNPECDGFFSAFYYDMPTGRLIDTNFFTTRAAAVQRAREWASAEKRGSARWRRPEGIRVHAYTPDEEGVWGPPEQLLHDDIDIDWQAEPNPRKKKAAKRKAAKRKPTRARRNPIDAEFEDSEDSGEIEVEWDPRQPYWDALQKMDRKALEAEYKKVRRARSSGETKWKLDDIENRLKRLTGSFPKEREWAWNPKSNPASQRKMKAFLRKNPECESVYVVTLVDGKDMKSEFFVDRNDALERAKDAAGYWAKSSVQLVYPQGPGQIADREAIWFSEESNPTKRKATKRKATRRRRNPTSSAGIHQMIADGITKEVESAYKKKSGFYTSKALGPAGTLLIAPGDVLEYGEKTYSGDSAQWKWVNFANDGTFLGEGIEKTASAAIAEASTALVKWASPLISIVLERVVKAGKKTDTDRITKEMSKFRIRTFSVDGTKLPKVGKVVTKKGPGRMTVKIFGEKPKAAWAGAGDTVWYVQILDDDGKPIGGRDGKKGSGKVGPLLDGVTVDSTVNMLVGLFQGEDDAIEANPIQRKRLNAKARRMTAKKNGIGDWIGGPKRTVKEGRLETSEVGSFEHAVGIPADPTAAHQIGYYEGILRGINTCKWYPSPTGMWDRYKFRREMRQRYFDAINNLAVDITEAPKKVRRIAKIR